MARKKLDGLTPEDLTPEELITLAREGASDGPVPWRRFVSGQINRDKVTLSTELEDGTVVTAVYSLDADGTVYGETTTRSPKAGITESASWLARHVDKATSKEFELHLFSANNWLGLSDEFRAGLRPRRPGRRGQPVADLALLVERYVNACANSAEPMEHLLTTEYPDENKNRLNQRLRRAVALGLMTERPGKGRAGGEMTDKCRRVLAGEEG